MLLGLLAHRAGGSAFEALGDVTKVIGDLWVAALQMIAVPLMIAYTLSAIVSARGDGAVGALTARAVLLFAVLLAAAAVVTLALAPLIVRLYPSDPATIAALETRVPVAEAAREAASAGHGSLGSWFAALVPRNLFESAARGEILPLLLFTVLLGLAIAALPAAHREPLERVVAGLAQALLTIVRWILALTPMGVFALAFRFALGAGSGALGVLGAWVVIACVVLLLCTLLLYPVSASLGRTTILGFARGVAPAQLVAATTRSSIASLPALVQGGRDRLHLPDTATGLVLPLGVSMLKLSQIVTNLTKLLFLAHVCGVRLDAGKIATFLTVVGILSFSTAGLPSRGVMRSLPAYLAAGIPIGAVVIVDTVEAVPDIFQTVLNVTGHMTAALLLSRSSRAPRRAAAPRAAPPVARASAAE